MRSSSSSLSRSTAFCATDAIRFAGNGQYTETGSISPMNGYKSDFGLDVFRSRVPSSTVEAHRRRDAQGPAPRPGVAS